MGYETKDIDLAGQQASLLEIDTILSPLPRGVHILGCFSGQLHEELRGQQEAIGDISLLGASHTICISGSHAGQSANGLAGEDGRVREQTSKPRKRCKEREGDDVIEKSFEGDLDWRDMERMRGRMYGHGHLGGQLRARRQVRHSECQRDKLSMGRNMLIGK